MNILMLTNTFTPHVGGVARSVEAFTAEYRRMGHRVLIVAPLFDDAPEDEVDVIRVPAVQHFNGSDFSFPMPVPIFLAMALDEFKADIVHSHHPFLLGDTALRIAAARDTPIVFTHHTMYDHYTHYVGGAADVLGRFITDLAIGYCNLCDAVIAPSGSVADFLKEHGVETRIVVNPTGVDRERFAKGDGQAFRAKHGIPADAFVVGHVGRLAPEKNLPFLAKTFVRYLRQTPDAHCLIVGKGPSAEGIRETFVEHNLQDRLHMPGAQSGQDLIDSYHAMDVFGFSSQSETQGMVITEAMAAGLPVVAVDANGVRDVVEDGVNGRLLPQEDEAAFVAAIEDVRRRLETNRDEILAALDRTAHEFSMPRCAQRSIELYESLIREARRRQNIEESPWASVGRMISEEWKLLGVRARAMTDALIGADDDSKPST